MIVNYRAWDALDRCLSSLATAPPSIEIVVVDNDSADGELAAFQSRNTRVAFVENAGNPGFGHACNRGAKHSRAPQLLFLNPDTEAAPDALLELLRLHLSKGPGISTLPQNTSGGRPGKISGPFPKITTAFGWSRALRRMLRGSTSSPDGFRDVDWVSGSALMIDRAVFDEIGGFDETFWMYYEDVDLCRRAQNGGFRARICPAPAILHVHGGASRQTPTTALTTRTEVVVSRHVYIHKHLRGLSRWFLHISTSLSRLLLPLPLALFSHRRRQRTVALMRYYRSAFTARQWKTKPGSPEHHQ